MLSEAEEIRLAGNIGLMKAVKRFDPTAACAWCPCHALDQGRDSRIHPEELALVKVATTKAQRKLFFNLRSLKTITKASTPCPARRPPKSPPAWASSRKKWSRWKPACPAAIWRWKATG